MEPGRMASPTPLPGASQKDFQRPSCSGQGQRRKAPRDQDKDAGNWTVTSSMTPVRKRQGPAKRVKRLVSGFPGHRPPRTLTEIRKKKIMAFNDLIRSNPEKLSVTKMGKDEWITQLIPFMKERRHHTPNPDDVRYWMRTSTEFFNQEYSRMGLNQTSSANTSSAQQASSTSAIPPDSGVSGESNPGETESASPPDPDDDHKNCIPGGICMTMEDGNGRRTVHTLLRVRNEDGDDIVTFGPPATLDEFRRRSAFLRSAILGPGASMPELNDDPAGGSMPEEATGATLSQIKTD